MKDHVGRFYNSIENVDGLTQIELIAFFLYYLTIELNADSGTAKEISCCFEACDLAIPANTAARLAEGAKTSAKKVIGMGDEGRVDLRPIFELVRTGTGEDGTVLAEHRATGYLPTFLNEFIVRNLVKRGEPYL